MKSAWFFASLTAFALFAGSALAEDKPGEKKPGDGKRPAKGKFDGKGKGPLGEGMFKRLDADSDGKVSKDEFKKLADAGPGGKLKDNPELLDRIFSRLDANGDGSISAEEFKKFGEGKGKGGKPGEGKPGQKPPVKKPGDDK